MKKHKQLLRDPLAYVESIGKNDRHHTLEALDEEGADTVLRICLSPKDAVPMRALGYVAAAQHIHAAYFPKAQLQVVIPEHTIALVNGIETSRTRSAAMELFESMRAIPHSGRESERNVIYAMDSPVMPKIDTDKLQAAIRGTKEDETLQRRAAR
jgi:hypothetical protein